LRLHYAVKQGAKERGFGMDTGITSDLARILRVAGSHNFKRGKDDTKPVTILVDSPDVSYTFEELDAILPQLPKVQAKGRGFRGKPQGAQESQRLARPGARVLPHGGRVGPSRGPTLRHRQARHVLPVRQRCQVRGGLRRPVAGRVGRGRLPGRPDVLGLLVTILGGNGDLARTRPSGPPSPPRTCWSCLWPPWNASTSCSWKQRPECFIQRVAPKATNPARLGESERPVLRAFCSVSSR
jgi:hypothetical protein